MLIPLTIIAIATRRKASIILSPDRIMNSGAARLRISANIATKIGRVPRMVETKDIGPLSIAQKLNTNPIAASVSLKTSRAMAEFLRFIFLNCLKVPGCVDISSKVPDMQNAVRVNEFQNEI